MSKVEEARLDEAEIAKALLQNYNIRVEPEMSRYVRRQLDEGAKEFAVIGGDARTGVPLRLIIDPSRLRQPPAIATVE